MALFTIQMESRFLQGNTTVSVVMPDLPLQETEPARWYTQSGKFPVLWLLHGTSGDHSDYIRKTSLERYVWGKNLVVVMPSGLNSDYQNWPGFATGLSMEDFLLQELIPMVQSWLPVSTRPEDNFIAGLSMGGRGALMLGLRHPEYFGAIGSMSFVPYRLEHDRQAPVLPVQRMENVIANAGGWQEYCASDYNLWDRLQERSRQGSLMPIYLSMGDRDFYYPYWKEFEQHPAAENPNVYRRLVHGYGHEWPFWDQELPRLIEFFLKK